MTGPLVIVDGVHARYEPDTGYCLFHAIAGIDDTHHIEELAHITLQRLAKAQAAAIWAWEEYGEHAEN